MKKVLMVSLMILLMVSLLLSCTSKPAATPVPTAPPAPKAPAPTEPPKESVWDKTVKAAREEGMITLYASWIRKDAEKTITEVMNQKYGIKVEWVMGRGAQNNEKVRMEFQTGNHVSDLIAGGHTVGVVQMQRDFAASIPPLPAERNAQWRVDPWIFDKEQRRFLVLEIYPGGIFLNTELVKPEDEPKSWYDILDPKWKGKMVMDDPRVSGPASLWFVSAVKEDALGQDFMRKLATQDMLLLRRAYREIVDHVAKGSKHLCPAGPTVSAVEAVRAGAPMKLVVPKEGTGSIGNGINLLKNAPHPNAAAVLLNWLLTEEGQTKLSQGQGSPALLKTVPQDWVFEATRLDQGPPLWIPTRADLEDQRATYALAKTIFGQD